MMVDLISTLTMVGAALCAVSAFRSHHKTRKLVEENQQVKGAANAAALAALTHSKTALKYATDAATRAESTRCTVVQMKELAEEVRASKDAALEAKDSANRDALAASTHSKSAESYEQLARGSKEAATRSALDASSQARLSLTHAQTAGSLTTEVKRMKEAVERAAQGATNHSKAALDYSEAALAHANLAGNNAKLAENHAKVGLEFSMSAASRFASSLFKAAPPATVAPAVAESEKKVEAPETGSNVLPRKSSATRDLAKKILDMPNVNW